MSIGICEGPASLWYCIFSIDVYIIQKYWCSLNRIKSVILPKKYLLSTATSFRKASIIRSQPLVVKGEGANIDEEEKK